MKWFRKKQFKITRKEEEEELQRREENHKYNIILMMNIVGNCPEHHAIEYKFNCGNWSEENICKHKSELLELISDSKHGWSYLRGSGFGICNPDFYGRDAEKIVWAITYEPNRWLDGCRLVYWRYVQLP